MLFRSRELDLGKSVANIIRYTLDESDSRIDIYGNVIDAIRDFHHQQQDTYSDSE